MVLSALCVDKYAAVINSVQALHKAGKVNEKTVKFAIVQDCFFSNLVMSNYQHPKLRLVLHKVLKDLERNQKGKESVLVRNIKDILSGKEWRECKVEYVVNQPVVLKTNACK